MTSRSEEVARMLPRPLRAVVLVLLLVLVLVPVLYMLFASVASDLSVAAGHFLPDRFDLENYRRIWSTTALGRGLVNSIVVAGTVAILCAFVALLSAYVLVRFAF